MTVEYLVILTVTQPGHGTYATLNRLLQVGPEATRASIYEYMRGQVPDHLKDGNVLFFSAEPNSIAPEAGTRASGGAVTS